MIRLGKLTDYGLVLMSHMASQPPSDLHTVRDLALQCHLPLPTVSKLLKNLLHGGLLISHRGTKGGYSLSREPQLISLTEIISALEGPLALTQCSSELAGPCEIESSCRIKDNQRIINQLVRGALETVTLSDLVRPMHLTNIRNDRGDLVPTITSVSGRMQ